MRIATLALCGCTTGLSAGAQGMTTKRDGSIEATASGRLGLGDADTAAGLVVEGGLGATPSGGAEGRLGGGFEYARFGARDGWQLRGTVGGAFGSYQASDLMVELAAGLNWNLARKIDGSASVHSIAVDAIVGYGFRTSGQGSTRDGALFGLAVTYRYDYANSARFPGPN